MTTRARSFDEVSSLDEDALRKILEIEVVDAPERLFAIWTLALQNGDGAIAGHVSGEPSAGVRRHLPIILAATQLDLLVALGRHDPDAGVRASAATVIARLASGGRIPWEVVFERMSDASPEVRSAIVREVPRAAPPSWIEMLGRALDDESPHVRRDALDAAFRLLSPADLARRVAPILVAESATDARSLLDRWVEHLGAPAAVHAVLRNATIDARVVAIRLLSDRWADVALLWTPDDHPDVAETIRRVFRPRIGARGEVPLDVVATWLDEPVSLRPEVTATLAFRLDHGERLSDEAWRDLDPRARRRLAILDASLRDRGLDPVLALVADDDGDEELIDERLALLTLLAQAREHS